MDWIIWLIAIVVIVAVVWWLLKRNSSRGKPGSAGTGTAATHDSPHLHPHDAVHGASHRGAMSGGGSAASASAAGLAWMPTSAGFSQAEPEPEWETQWSETAPAEPHAAIHHEAPGHPAAAAAAEATAEPTAEAPEPTAEALPVHHPEYTEPHAPTLPGAESAAAEGAFAETAASHVAEPAGHLALDQPYGDGSAAPSADGSGPAGFTVKGNASSMTYHDETSSAFEETRAEVWFVSIAHAEAAGFRPPRRARQ